MPPRQLTRAEFDRLYVAVDTGKVFRQVSPKSSVCSDDSSGYDELEYRGCSGEISFALPQRGFLSDIGVLVAIKRFTRAAHDPRSQANLQNYVIPSLERVAKLPHPHISKIYSLCQVDGQLNVVMERGCGLSLFKELSVQQQRASPAYFWMLMSQICAAVHHLHGHGMVHRDLKPENIIIATDAPDASIGDRQVMLVDLDDTIPIHTRHDLVVSRNLVGTLPYVGPEVVHLYFQQNLDLAFVPCNLLSSDIWAIGCIAYSLLLGDVPISFPEVNGDIVKHMAFIIDQVQHHPDEWLQNLPRGLIGPDERLFLQGTLCVDPQQRWSSGQASAFAAERLRQFVPSTTLADMNRYLDAAENLVNSRSAWTSTAFPEIPPTKEHPAPERFAGAYAMRCAANQFVFCVQGPSIAAYEHQAPMNLIGPVVALEFACVSAPNLFKIVFWVQSPGSEKPVPCTNRSLVIFFGSIQGPEKARYVLYDCHAPFTVNCVADIVFSFLPGVWVPKMRW